MNHKSLDAWKFAMELSEEVYILTKAFPREEVYGLTSQMRRAAVSVPSNLSEGAARSSQREFSQFLSISLGSLAELETQLFLAERFEYVTDTSGTLERLERVRALLLGLRRKVCGRGHRGPGGSEG